MLKLNLQYFGHLMQTTDSFEKTGCRERLKVGGEADNRRWDGWMASPTHWNWVWVSSGSWWWTGKPGMLQSMGSQKAGHDWATELNYASIYMPICHLYFFFGKMSIFCWFFLTRLFFCCCSVVWVVYIFWKLIPCWLHLLQIFLPSCRLFFHFVCGFFYCSKACNFD